VSLPTTRRSRYDGDRPGSGKRDQMAGNHISAASTNFFLTAALLALFGMAALNQAGPHGPLQLVLAAVMGVAGFLLRSGTAEARLIGLGAAGLTTAVGAVLLVTGGFYVPGTIIAIFALFRLAGAPGAVVQAGAGPTPAHLQAHLPAQLPPWRPGQGAPVPPPPAQAFGAPVAPPAAPPASTAPPPPAGQEWDYFGKPT
jgi:hypothetical protein